MSKKRCNTTNCIIIRIFSFPVYFFPSIKNKKKSQPHKHPICVGYPYTIYGKYIHKNIISRGLIQLHIQLAIINCANKYPKTARSIKVFQKINHKKMQTCRTLLDIVTSRSELRIAIRVPNASPKEGSLARNTCRDPALVDTATN